jgi:hypothetical protein
MPELTERFVEAVEPGPKNRSCTHNTSDCALWRAVCANMT